VPHGSNLRYIAREPFRYSARVSMHTNQKKKIIGKVIKKLIFIFLKHMEEEKPSDGILLI
jgi:hypothetical protein